MEEREQHARPGARQSCRLGAFLSTDTRRSRKLTISRAIHVQISFGVAPAMAAFCIGLRTTADTILLTIFICAGIARLARFNATVAAVPKDDSGKHKYFEGLPIPSSLLLCAIMAGCVKTGAIEGTALGKGLPGGLVGPIKELLGIDVHAGSFVFLGWATLMISKTLRCVSRCILC